MNTASAAMSMPTFTASAMLEINSAQAFGTKAKVAVVDGKCMTTKEAREYIECSDNEDAPEPAPSNSKEPAPRSPKGKEKLQIPPAPMVPPREPSPMNIEHEEPKDSTSVFDAVQSVPVQSKRRGRKPKIQGWSEN